MYLKQVSLSDKFTSKYCLEVNLLGLSQTLVSCQNPTMNVSKVLLILQQENGYFTKSVCIFGFISMYSLQYKYKVLSILVIYF